MQEVIVKTNGEIEKIRVLLVCGSRNPKTKRYSVNIYYVDNDKQKWVQLFCQEEEMQELAVSIREGKITDLTSYLAERRL